MRYLFLILAFLPLIAFAQFEDDFSDGDFTNSPAWLGDTENFIVNSSQQLQLYINPQAAGTSYLVTASSAINDATWEFYLKMNFNPTATNYCDVYLVSNSPNLNSTTNGYFVKIGNTKKEVSLYRKDATSTALIIDGEDSRVDLTNVEVKIKVTRDSEGNWTLESDILDGNGYKSEGSAFDNTYYSSAYFGIKCTYTTTRSQHFFFDDFVVTGTGFVDEEAPELLTASVLNEHALLLTWNEALDAGNSLQTSNFQVSNGMGEPESATFYQSNPSQIVLNFQNAFTSPNNYILQYQGVSDLSNNFSSGSISFSYITFSPGMIVFNEIMADPDPVVGLPNAEYVEIYNTTNFVVDIGGWSYTHGSTTKQIPAYQMQANEYLILCKTDFVNLFTEYGNVLGIEAFPQITNTGQTLILKDNEGQEIDRVSYTIGWYGTSYKEDGGWSLEKIDPTNTCSPNMNWTASVDPSGGTPGRQNSVFANVVDTIPPYIINVSISSGNELLVKFSEHVDTSTSLVLSNYDLQPGFGTPIYAFSEINKTDEVTLQFPSSFIEDVEYSLHVRNIKDVCDNIMQQQTINFMLYDAKEYEVIFSEIMAVPDPVVLLPNAEYIELYNRTDKNIDLTDWVLSVGSTKKTLSGCTINANSYLVLCNQNNVNLFTGVENIVGITSFPSIPNTSGTLTLSSKSDKVINTVSYSDKWYKDKFKANGGYSLEIIDLNNPCEGENNWRASNDVSGGTPGRQNSINGTNPDLYSPYPIAAELIAPDTLIVYFNEILKKESCENPENYSVENYGNPTWVSASKPDFAKISMKFSQNFEQGKVYYLNIKDQVQDCAGNTVDKNTSIRFGIGDSITKDDIVINEILFNPLSGGSDFVELYNNSDNLCDLKSLWFINKDDSAAIDNSYQITTISRLLLPEEYCAISKDIAFIENNYHVPFPENLFQTANLPSMADKSGNIFLIDRFTNIIDSVYYNEKQHYKLLASKDGVSLERINFNRSSADETNWHSASETVGFATPGYKNSQYSDEIISESKITISPEVFSPDNDGRDDILNISYNLNSPGYTATIAIYNADGQFVKFIANNEMLATEGNFTWDGFDAVNVPCPIGIYIIYIEMFSLNGEKIVEKHAAVLSRKSY